MVRALCLAILGSAILAEAAGAQGPTLGFEAASEVASPAPNRLATLGDPLSQPVPDRVPASKPPAGENVRPPQPASPAPAILPPPTTPYTGSYTTLPRPISDPVSVTRPGQPVVASCEECADCRRRNNPWLDNLSLFAGIDGSKEPADLGINANFGYRVAVNWGLPLLEEAGVGVQVGTALNYSQNAIRVLRFLDGTVDRWQSFTTLGMFQRNAGGLHWGVVYDLRFDEYYDNISAAQWRALIGFEMNPDNEIGFWATVRAHGDTASIGPVSFNVQPISQWNVYWRHIWTNEIVTRLWIGIAEEHSRFNILLPGQTQINHPFTFGADIYVPLSDNLAIFGEAHFITPNDTGTVTATLGVAWYPGTARGTARSRFAPVLSLANNSTFALDVR